MGDRLGHACAIGRKLRLRDELQAKQIGGFDQTFVHRQISLSKLDDFDYD